MPKTSSIISTVASEFSLMIMGSRLPSYDFQIEVGSSDGSEPVSVTLLLAGDGLACWVDGYKHGKPQSPDLEQAVYEAIRHLPIVQQTIRDINIRADRSGYDADC